MQIITMQWDTLNTCFKSYDGILEGANALGKQRKSWILYKERMAFKLRIESSIELKDNFIFFLLKDIKQEKEDREEESEEEGVWKHRG